jgi:monomeric isocitrate dehydrogenase
MSTEKQVEGPASYFPSIEKKYGFPVQHWLQLLENRSELKHMEMVVWLKSECGIGHGHANALVAYFRSQDQRPAV